jgi:diguanylate cyclase (GGDEF)-like protein
MRQESPNRREVLMGAGLVAVSAAVVVATSWALGVSHQTVADAALVMAVMVVVDAALAFMPWSRLPRRVLLAFPILLMIGAIVLAATTHGVSSNYNGFFTLSFIYIGITQVRGTPTLLALLAIPGWIYCQQGMTEHIWIRVPIAVVIWVLVGEALAEHISVNRRRTKELATLATTDLLTGLTSRLVIMNRVEEAISSSDGGGSCLLVLDLDGFKAINDAFGHASGDELLVVVANRIRASVASDDTVARLGGDEFAILLDDCSISDAVAIGQRLIETVASPIGLVRGNVIVTASVGIIDMEPCANAADALRDVDLALYGAKHAGKNQLSLFEPEMRELIASRLLLGAELRTALDEEQFVAHYQPVVEVQSGAVVGFEALVRWNHPTRGQLAAGNFIDVCEEVGLVVPLGLWMLREACLQARRWQLKFPFRPFTMAVNLSSRQLFDTDLVAEVKSALSDADLRGEALVLEITERLLLVDSPFVLRQLDELKELGVRIAIDDFGTGYSSLAYLRDFPIDILKIDRSFVDALDRDERAVALARSIVSIARALDLDVIAEGTETEEQVDTLVGIGCTVMQGYHFCRPQSPSELGDCLVTQLMGSRKLLAARH